MQFLIFNKIWIINMIKKFIILLMLSLSLASCYKVGVKGDSYGKVEIQTEKRFFALAGLIPYQEDIKCPKDIAMVTTKMGFVDYIVTIGTSILTAGLAPLFFTMTTVEYACAV